MDVREAERWEEEDERESEQRCRRATICDDVSSLRRLLRSTGYGRHTARDDVPYRTQRMQAPAKADKMGKL